MLTLRRVNALKVRYLIKFTKESNIKFISHLDLLRTIQRVIRRSELPVEYSKGFNPHINMSIAQPLSVGVYSDGEYFDLMLVEDLPVEEVVAKLNEKRASGIKFISANKIVIVENAPRIPQGMALIDACRYIIKIKYTETSLIEKEISDLLKQKSWNTTKKSKRGQVELDIRPLIFEFKYWIKDSYLVINTLLRSGSLEHLSADVVINYIKNNTSNVSIDFFTEVKREEMYYFKEDKLEPLYKFR